ncbi:MRS7 family protein-like protein [Calycina marina]|uniref:MRS7 family protein-like protein n=1 Tax=Calycina marina TaxID=1763456 RepID=A0A9P8CBG2_9HELO|nr:MRS7 family protein-like protein [Calycina marina]
MSVSSRLARNAVQSSILSGRCTLHQVALRSPAHTSLFRRNNRILPAQNSILAIMSQQKAVSTNSHTTGRSAGGPPPGFNAKEAKKPLTGIALNAANKETSDKAKEYEINSVPRNDATGVSKTDATEALTLSQLAGSKPLDKQASKKEEVKLTLGQKIKKEAQHYWDGTKLLATEVRISSKLALKMAAGYELSRREYRQLQRTVQDMARLVPFSVFVLVPFAELLLPIALRLFPNMLPSTYEGQKSKDAKFTTLRSTRKEVSGFLRETLKETGLPLNPANLSAKKDEFSEFFRKVRATGETPSSEDVIKVCKIFKDDLTLDNLSRPQLVGMCRYMNLNTYGTDMMLRYQIRHRMRQIKRDDRAISFEGVDTLSVPELQQSCISRGIRTHGMSPGRLRDDLQSWLDLRLKHGVPSTLLVLSNAFMYSQGKDSEFSSQIDALTGVLSAIPEELFHEIELEVHNAEGSATNKQRLEVLKEQQDLIQDENEQDESNKKAGSATPRDDENIDEKEEHTEIKAADIPDSQAKEAAHAEAESAKTEEHETQVKKSSEK